MQQNQLDPFGSQTISARTAATTQLRSISPLLAVMAAVVIAAVAFGLGYLFKGWVQVEYIAQEVVTPKAQVDEFTENSPAANDEVAEIIPEGYFYVDTELGFSVTLPEKYSVLTTQKSESIDTLSVSTSFNLPITSEGADATQMVLSIVKAAPGSDVLLYADQLGQLLAETSDGYSFYYFHPLDVAIDTDQPEYQIFMSLVDRDLFPIIKSGFKIL